MTEEQQIRNIQIRLTCSARETVITARPLHKSRINQRRAYLRRERPDERLITQEGIVSAAGRPDSASVECGSYQQVPVGRVLNGVADGKMVCLIELVVDFHETVIHIGGLQKVLILIREAEALLDRVDRRQILHQDRGIGGRLPPPLPLVVGKEKRLILSDRTAEGATELVLAQCGKAREG